MVSEFVYICTVIGFCMHYTNGQRSYLIFIQCSNLHAERHLPFLWWLVTVSQSIVAYVPTERGVGGYIDFYLKSKVFQGRNKLGMGVIIMLKVKIW